MNLIYQYWQGTLTEGNKAGTQLMKEYADRIGVEYQFELNPNWSKDLGSYTPHYNAFKFIYDTSYDKYDSILFADCDVIPVSDLEENIFDEFTSDIGICEEHMMPNLRQKYNIGGITGENDNRWCRIVEPLYDIEFPRDLQSRPRVFNSGVVLYSRQGRQEAREKFVGFQDYLREIRHLPAFYSADQNYLNAMMLKFNWQLMDYKWNSQIFYRPRTNIVEDYRDNANFVHVQLRGADHYPLHRLRSIVNG